ncbi:MAG TPA: aminoglycoside phosphotransferase family protein [Caldilineaceae bacterium]|nr:aminoglycoside phosphotransferase family protein [Caldilineaceae bacterium]
MLTKPDLPDEAIRACLHDAFALRSAQITFLPLGWVHNALYRVIADNGTPYLLKLRRGGCNEIAVAVPVFLHAQGIRQVMAPLATTTHDWWVHAHGFDWTLYPFFEGKTGFEVALSQRQWTVFGEVMQAVHATSLPSGLADRIPYEAYSPRWRECVRAFHNQAEEERDEDPIAASLAAFWRTKRDEIARIVERAEQLALVLQQRATPMVVCHADLHGRNVLMGAEDELAIVDWDEPLLAPKERDLMFIGGGIGGIWNTDQETRWFYDGYGQTEIDLVALSYYRYERIVVDIAEVAERIFGKHGSVEERQKDLGLVNQFLPNNVVEIAHRTYQQLA